MTFVYQFACRRIPIRYNNCMYIHSSAFVRRKKKWTKTNAMHQPVRRLQKYNLIYNINITESNMFLLRLESIVTCHSFSLLVLLDTAIWRRHEAFLLDLRFAIAYRDSFQRWQGRSPRCDSNSSTCLFSSPSLVVTFSAGRLRDEECLLFLLRYTWMYILINAIEFRRAKERSAKGNECALKGIIEDKVVERTW